MSLSKCRAKMKYVRKWKTIFSNFRRKNNSTHVWEKDLSFFFFFQFLLPFRSKSMSFINLQLFLGWTVKKDGRTDELPATNCHNTQHHSPKGTEREMDMLLGMQIRRRRRTFLISKTRPTTTKKNMKDDEVELSVAFAFDTNKFRNWISYLYYYSIAYLASAKFRPTKLILRRDNQLEGKKFNCLRSLTSGLSQQVLISILILTTAGERKNAKSCFAFDFFLQFRTSNDPE